MPEPLPPLREVIARYGIRARRQLGQHFLLDLNLCRRIVRAAGDLAGKTAVEIGSGPGGLTRALLETGAARVIAIERDPRCIDALSDLSRRYGDRLHVVAGDALDVDVSALAGTDRIAIVANLPYNVATPLLIGWLRRVDSISAMTLMFQKEVAERIVAAPGTSAYGRLAVVAQWLCEAKRAFDVAPTAFVPPPRVTSTVVNLVPARRASGAGGHGNSGDGYRRRLRPPTQDAALGPRRAGRRSGDVPGARRNRADGPGRNASTGGLLRARARSREAQSPSLRPLTNTGRPT